MNLGLDNKYVLLHLGERMHRILEMHFPPLLQPLMGLGSIHPMVLSYFELDRYRGLRGGMPACKRVQVSPLLRVQTPKILLRESFKAQTPQHPTQTVPYKHALLWGISCFVCPLSGTLLSRYQRFNFSSPWQT